jgi:hypothetical protein
MQIEELKQLLQELVAIGDAKTAGVQPPDQGYDWNWLMVPEEKLAREQALPALGEYASLQLGAVHNQVVRDLLATIVPVGVTFQGSWHSHQRLKALVPMLKISLVRDVNETAGILTTFDGQVLPIFASRNGDYKGLDAGGHRYACSVTGLSQEESRGTSETGNHFIPLETQKCRSIYYS